MKIKSIQAGVYTAQLKTPFTTHIRSTSEVSGVVIKVEAFGGAFGFGEAPPTQMITGDSIESISSAVLGHIAPKLLGKDIDDFESLGLLLKASAVHNTSAKAALDIALHDLRARSLGIPLYALLGSSPKTIETDYTISLSELPKMAEEAANAVKDGWRILKVKLGCGSAKGDVGLANAVREAAPLAELRIDANQCWGEKEALEAIDGMDRLGVSPALIEQPVPYDNISGLKFVRDRSKYPILADEAVFSFADAAKVLDMHAADGINIKLMKCGGIREAQRIASLCEEYNIPAMIGCMMEGKVANAAACNFAISQPSIVMHDVDSPFLIKDSPFDGGPIYELPYIKIASSEPGLGILGFPRGVRMIGEAKL